MMSGVLCGRGVDLWASKIVELQAGRYKLQVPRAGASSRLDCLSLLLRGTRARRSSNQASATPAGTANHNNLRASHSEAFLIARIDPPPFIFLFTSQHGTGGRQCYCRQTWIKLVAARLFLPVCSMSPQPSDQVYVR